ncbi:MAG: DUF1874 domain-containing protein [Ignisphaera sp.]
MSQETRKTRKYLANTFSLNMLTNVNSITLTIERLTIEDFCREISDAINSIGHASTASVINTLCNTNLTSNRIEIKLHDGDELIVFQLKMRPPEGKVYTTEELIQLLNNNQIEFLKVRVEKTVEISTI